jgi:hypothetical protein
MLVNMFQSVLDTVLAEATAHVSGHIPAVSMDGYAYSRLYTGYETCLRSWLLPMFDQQRTSLAVAFPTHHDVSEFACVTYQTNIATLTSAGSRTSNRTVPQQIRSAECISKPSGHRAVLLLQDATVGFLV